MTLPDAYISTFRRFDDANGRRLTSWNWSAFLLGPIWYFYRGLWAKGLMYLFLSLGVSAIIGHMMVVSWWDVYLGNQALYVSIFFALWLGFQANYDLYLLNRTGTQFGEGVRVTPTPTAVSPAFGTNPGNVSDSLRALENARAQGVISAQEYAEKRALLEGRSDRERKLSALEEMNRAGIVSPIEYEAKKRDILMA